MIGTTAAIIGSAVIGAGASALASSKNSKAITQASKDTQAGSAQALAAQERARAENLALQRPLYDAGMPAIGARNALLGLGGPQAAPQAQQSAFGGHTPAAAGYGIADGQAGMDYYRGNVTGNRPGLGGNPPPVAQSYQTYAPAAPAPSPAGGQQSQQNAFDMFRNSTGYQFRVNEGMNALNSGYAGSGVLRSGAALKSLDDYRQGMASAEFGNYWNMLGEQQNLTSGAANAMSGVNTAYANNAGSLAVNAGNQQAQLAMARGANASNTIGAFGNIAGNALGYLAQPKYPTNWMGPYG